MTFLLDTNVVSEIRRDRDPNVRAWAETAHDVDLYLSVLTVGEIRKGIERVRERDPNQASALTSWLSQLRERFARRLLPVDVEAAEEWGRLNAGSPRRTVDSLLAATARVHNLTLVTHSVGDFVGCGVPVLDPWVPAAGS